MSAALRNLDSAFDIRRLLPFTVSSPTDEVECFSDIIAAAEKAKTGEFFVVSANGKVAK